MSQPTRLLLSLVAGLLGGVLLARASITAADWGVAIAQPVGTAWLNGLQMTVIPLVLSLLVTGVASTAEAASAGRLAVRTIGASLVFLTVAAIAAAVATLLLLDLFPIPVEAAAQLRAAIAGGTPVPTPPPLAELIAAIVPNNVVGAAASGALLSLIVFTLIFAFALTRIDAPARDLLVRFFAAIRDAMLVVVGWVLWLAPLGVFALAFGLGARAGGGAVAVLAHYVVIVACACLLIGVLAYVVVLVFGGLSPVRFARAALPAQVVALSTQSSLATLPAMIEAAAPLGVPRNAAGIVLPLAVSVFRAASAAANIAVALYLAAVYGVSLGIGMLVTGALVAAAVSLAAVGLPAQVSFFATIGPVCLALGVPVELLPLLLAVETIPDLFRTVGNVTADMAVMRLAGAGDDCGDEGDAVDVAV